MMTLNRLIEERREELRREREEIEREQRAAITEEQRRVAVVAGLFSNLVGIQYGLDMSAFPYQIQPQMVDEAANRFEIYISLNPPEEHPEIAYTCPVILHEEEGRLEVIQNDLPWDGWRDSDNWLSCDNLIDAIIYALYGEG